MPASCFTTGCLPSRRPHLSVGGVVHKGAADEVGRGQAHAGAEQQGQHKQAGKVAHQEQQRVPRQLRHVAATDAGRAVWRGEAAEG